MSKVAPEPIVEKKDESLSSDNKKKEEIPLSAIMSFLRTCACSVVYFNCCGTRYKRNTKPPFSEVYACPFRTNQDIENATLTELETRIGYEKRYFGPRRVRGF